jgi:protein TonB
VSHGAIRPSLTLANCYGRRWRATIASRLFASALLGALVSVALFWVLAYSIQRPASIGDLREAVRINFTRMRRDTPVETKRDEKVERKPPPPVLEAPEVALDAPNVGGAVGRLAPSLDVGHSLSRLTVAAGSDRDVLPLVRVAPDYPPRALARGVEGWVQVRFTISEIGTVKNAKVVAADPPGLFEDAALKSIARWRYSPKIEGGEAVERVGVETVIRFQIEK